MSYELTRKDRLCENIVKMQERFGKEVFNILPDSYILPDEFADFYSHFHNLRSKELTNMWIIKPQNSSQGKGIYIVSIVAAGGFLIVSYGFCLDWWYFRSSNWRAMHYQSLRVEPLSDQWPEVRFAPLRLHNFNGSLAYIYVQRRSGSLCFGALWCFARQGRQILPPY